LLTFVIEELRSIITDPSNVVETVTGDSSAFTIAGKKNPNVKNKKNPLTEVFLGKIDL
jgi:hypothetical protein